ncbi:MAG: hypothetical protein CVU03_12300 [Bacteroidetes bacterium HGW-Bacteroidetes-2]|jgi:hypothetical protein|nr:MAG: hypothetical protein CVU03_12300 [Bacteroidetes bacterium HGW-Bacteroidetes-2]
MKKITLLLALAISSTAFSQISLVELNVPSETVTINQNQIFMDPCSSQVPSNALENGLFFGGATNQRLAVDIAVAADVEFSIETITVNVAGQATNFTLIFYDDVAGLPGNEILTLDSVIDFTVGEVLIGNNFGFDFYTYTFGLLSPVPLAGMTGTGSTFWMEVVSDAVAWEATTAVINGLPLAFNNDNSGGVWSISPTTELVYSVAGQCNPVLGIGDNILSFVTVYPNPISDILNVKVPASVQINEVSLIDLLGRNTGAVLANGTIDVSNLSKGIYMLTLNTTTGSVTKKIVKK